MAISTNLGSRRKVLPTMMMSWNNSFSLRRLPFNYRFEGLMKTLIADLCTAESIAQAVPLAQILTFDQPTWDPRRIMAEEDPSSPTSDRTFYEYIHHHIFLNANPHSFLSISSSSHDDDDDDNNAHHHHHDCWSLSPREVYTCTHTRHHILGHATYKTCNFCFLPSCRSSFSL
jgi:hypothetical protein